MNNNENNENVRTMEFVCKDDWNVPVYKCIETNTLYKDLSSHNSDIPDLYSCGNEIDGDPCYPIKKDFRIIFKDRFKKNEYEFEYLLLSRLQSDCNYYLGYGNRYTGHLWAGSEQAQIEKMKELYKRFPKGEKPEWLTWKQILDYEKKMII
jgi:hypothetical protein